MKKVLVYRKLEKDSFDNGIIGWIYTYKISSISLLIYDMHTLDDINNTYLYTSVVKWQICIE